MFTYKYDIIIHPLDNYDNYYIYLKIINNYLFIFLLFKMY